MIQKLLEAKVRSARQPLDSGAACKVALAPAEELGLSGDAVVTEPGWQPFGEQDYLPTSMSSRWYRARVLGHLAGLEGGKVGLRDADGLHGTDDHDPLAIRQLEAPSEEIYWIHVRDPRAYRAMVLSGDLGFADALVEGWIQCDRIVGLVRLFVRNLRRLDQVNQSGWSVRRWVAKVRHWLRRNTRQNANRNIAAHYDLSNEFFASWLDETMSYSSAVFGDLPQRDTSRWTVDRNPAYHRSQWELADASREKLRRLCEKLELDPTDHLVEIGCGWGGLALYACQNYGCRVTGVTLSVEQLKWAQQQVTQAGLEDKINLRLCDYRDLEGQFDKLVSVEMIEAVGHQFLDQYFQKCCSLLKPDGRMVLQAITIGEHRWRQYQAGADFIREYIFPGGSLPSVGSILNSVAKETDFRPTHLEDMGLHYAETLRRWRTSFHRTLPKLSDWGFDQRFARMWDYYLAYCEAAFEEGHIGTVQLTLDRPGSRHQAMATTERLGMPS